MLNGSMITANCQNIKIDVQLKLKGEKIMEVLIVEASKIAIGIVVGAGTIILATIKGWWVSKTPEAKKKFVKVMGKALADGRITQEEYDEIINEI